MVRDFAFDARWPSQVNDQNGEFEATFCELRITVDGKVVTSYKSDRESGSTIEAPVYHLAEWIAENWWALLWEPPKSDDNGHSEEYLERHSILTAQHGFPLPDIRLLPSGVGVQISAKSRYAQHAEVRFNVSAETVPDRSVVQEELHKFVEQTVKRLGDIKGTPLQEAWQLVRDTDKASVEFCKLVGALGLSPYDSHPKVEQALDLASKMLSSQQLLDMCMTSTADDVLNSAYVASKVHKALETAPEIDLSVFARVKPPADNVQAPAYRAGYVAARELRRIFGVKEEDVTGANRVLGELGMNHAGAFMTEKMVDSAVVGAVEKQNWRGKFALVPTVPQRQKFAVARAAYFLWTGGPDDCRILTSAATRDQQAGRAFAAELLMPQSFLRIHAKHGRIQRDTVTRIAEEAGVAPALANWQAKNHGLEVLN